MKSTLFPPPSTYHGSPEGIEANACRKSSAEANSTSRRAETSNPKLFIPSSEIFSRTFIIRMTNLRIKTRFAKSAPPGPDDRKRFRSRANGTVFAENSLTLLVLSTNARMLTPQDIRQIEEHGLSPEQIERQMERFRTGFPYLNLARAAVAGDGIVRMDASEAERCRRCTAAGATNGASSSSSRPPAQPRACSKVCSAISKRDRPDRKSAK